MDGFGLTVEIADELLAGGVDAITGGNHSWDGPDVARVLSYPEVVRPVNVDEGLGQGAVTLKGRSHALTVVTCSVQLLHCPGCVRQSPTRSGPHGSG